uniref:PH domain-containing protein n=1 Tax=Janibacter limosus TaxID=53458 RepID=A0AC61U131_9MICO|nr:PH domain-containing protein [Janibacter limosus]
MTDEGFVRVHPLSPFVRGGLIVPGVLGYLVSQQIDTITAAIAGIDDGGGEGGGRWVLVRVGVLVVVVLGAVVLGLASWWFTRYRLGEDSIEMHTGALFRQHRRVRYDRIRAVDVVRPLPGPSHRPGGGAGGVGRGWRLAPVDRLPAACRGRGRESAPARARGPGRRGLGPAGTRRWRRAHGFGAAGSAAGPGTAGPGDAAPAERAARAGGRLRPAER